MTIGGCLLLNVGVNIEILNCYISTACNLLEYNKSGIFGPQSGQVR